MGARSLRRIKQQTARTRVPERLISPEERALRGEKARLLADALMPMLTQIGVTDPNRAREIVRLVSEEGRAAAAATAGVRVPSPLTWGLVANLIAGRVERQLHDDDGDPFDGLPS